MAHQHNVTPVQKEIPGSQEQEQVIDPVCGMTLSRKQVRNMVFRPEQTWSFCSKDCQQKFLSRGFKPGSSTQSAQPGKKAA